MTNPSQDAAVEVTAGDREAAQRLANLGPYMLRGHVRAELEAFLASFRLAAVEAEREAAHKFAQLCRQVLPFLPSDTQVAADIRAALLTRTGDRHD